MNARHLAGLLVTLAGLVSGCLAPPMLQPGQYINAEVAIGLYPEGTERVELTLGSGERLRGLFVPAGEGAPVVLHLFESTGSAATLKFHYGVLCQRLQGLGFASLMVDYRGMGASDGTRSAGHLEQDAEAMWAAAVERAGGSPERVIVRGVSLGTVAATLLLEGGARPGAVVLHAPVAPNSAITRYAQQVYGPFFGWVAGSFHRSVTDADLVRELARYEGPCLVVAGTRDFFLSDSERGLLVQAVEASAGQLVEQPATGHLEQSVRARELDSAELDLVTALFPPQPLNDAELEALLRALSEDPKGGPAARERVDVPEVRERMAVLGGQARNAKPRIIAAVALQNDPSEDSLRYLWMLDERGLIPLPSFDQVVDSVSLEDPTGALSVETILSVAQFSDFNRRYGGGSVLDNVFLILVRVDTALEGGSGALTVSVDAGWDEAEITSDPSACIEALRSRSLDEYDVRRVSVRTLLKGARIPERVQPVEGGRPRLQVLEEGSWIDLDLDPSKHRRTLSFSINRELGWRARELLKERGVVEEPQTLTIGKNGSVTFSATSSEK